MNSIFEPTVKADFPVSDILNLLKKEDEVLIFTHRNPDGDAIGSSTAVQKYFALIGIKSHIVVPNPVPENLLWLDTNNAICVGEQNKDWVREKVMKSKIVVALDFNDWKRIDPLDEILNTYNGQVLLLDHHPQPVISGTSCYSDITASSTSEMVYRLIYMFDQAQFLNTSVAESIYTGMVTDTSSFRFSSTSPETMKVAAQLMEIGVKSNEVQDKLFAENRLSKLKLWGYALSEKLTFVSEVNLSYISLTEAELNQFDYQDGDLEGLVNYALSTAGAEVGVLLTEKQGKIRMSFRSKGKYSVNKFARTYFEGGGHEAAAGGASNLSMNETIEKLIASAKKEWQN